MRNTLAMAALSAAMLCAHTDRLAAQPATPATDKQTDTDGTPTWMAIPLDGPFGTEVTATGVAAAMTDAKNKKMGHVVFVIDSDGGTLDDARAIVAVMQQHAAAIKCHCVVKKAVGAALWVVAASDTVLMAPKSQPLSFDLVGESGDGKDAAAVVAARKQALGEELDKLASAHGHSGALFRSIIDPKAQAWLVTNPAPAVSAAQPADSSARQIDGPGATLVLQPELAVESGLARSVNEPSADAVGAALGITPWRSSKTVGATHMKHAAGELARLHRNFEASSKRYLESCNELESLMERLPAMKERAERDDPHRLTDLDYYTDGRSQHLTAQSARAWRRQSQAAMQDWSDIQGIARQAESTRREATQSADAMLRDAQSELKFRRVPVPKDAKAREVPKLNFDTQEVIRYAEQRITKLRREQAGP